MPGLVDGPLLSAVGRMVASTVLMAAIVALVLAALHTRIEFDHLKPAFIALVVGAGAGALTYLVATLALGLAEPRQLIARALRRGADAPA